MVTEKKVAIVTGGVSGIGAELSRTLIHKGWKVAALDLQLQAHLGHQLSREFGDDFVFIECDITKYSQLASAFEQTFTKWGRLDSFCSNAGIFDRSSIFVFKYRGKDEIPPEPDTSTTDVCFKALYYGTQLAIHFMRKNPTPGGSIIATSSVLAVHPFASMPEYCGAKAAINTFVIACAPVLEKENITINAVMPGIVATRGVTQDMIDTYGEDSMTKVSTIVNGYLKFLEDRSLNGKLLEGSIDKLLFQPEPVWADGEITKRTVKVYEPLYQYVHGEPSGLDILKPLK